MKMKPLLVVCCLFVSVTAWPQQGLYDLHQDTATLKPMFLMKPVQNFPQRNEQPIPQNYYAQHLPFFCRQELKMQQAHVPVTFRLGSMDDCNRLEQKPGYR